MDHDQRFKILIREFFAEFLLLFFSDWAARLDLTAPEWLDKELFPDPPDGARHVLDLVARVPMRDSATSAASLILVHFEIESPDRTTLLRGSDDEPDKLRSTSKLDRVVISQARLNEKRAARSFESAKAKITTSRLSI